jgi:hypothetical protein
MNQLEKRISKEFRKFYDFAVSKRGTVPEILGRLHALDEKFGKYRTYSFAIDGVLSNVAQESRNLVLAKKALSRLSSRKDTMPAAKFNYDMGNMLHLIGSLKMKTHHVRAFLETPEFFQSQVAFSKVKPDPLGHFERANTNLANFLDNIGRNYEAIYFYDRALLQDPLFGMAAGNKARAILRYIDFTPQASLPLLQTCSDLFQVAISDPELSTIGSEAVKEGFIAHKGKIDTYLREVRYTPKKGKYSTKSHFLNFCLEKNLFLNFDFGYLYDKQSLEDSFFPKFIQSIDDKKSKFSTAMSEKIHFSFHVFNQILEDFAASRYMYFLSKSRPFKELDKRTKYTYTLDYTKNSIKYGLTKRSFAALYSILEKLALITLNYTNTRHTFNTSENVYLNALLDPKFAKLAIEMNNYHLLAMYSLAKDFEEDHQYNKYRVIRNRIAHNFLSVDVGLLGEEEDFLILDTELEMAVEHMFHIVKSAVTYTILFLDGEAGKAGSKVGSMEALPQKNIFKHFP